MAIIRRFPPTFVPITVGCAEQHSTFWSRNYRYIKHMGAASPPWAEFVYRRLSTPSCEPVCVLPVPPSCRYDWLACRLMAPKEEDIKVVCHTAPPRWKTSACELFSRTLSPHLIRMWDLYPRHTHLTFTAALPIGKRKIKTGGGKQQKRGEKKQQKEQSRWK